MKKIIYHNLSLIAAFVLCLVGITYAASELVTQNSAQFNKNGTVYQLQFSNSQTITGDYAYDVVHNISTNGVSISFGAALPVGVVVLANLTTNSGYTVSYGTTNTSLFGVIKPGDSAKFWLKDGTNLWIQADTNSCKVRVFAVNQ